MEWQKYIKKARQNITYVHELCHTFGGDTSNAFSFGITLAMEILLSNYEVVESFRQKWELAYVENQIYNYEII